MILVAISSEKIYLLKAAVDAFQYGLGYTKIESYLIIIQIIQTIGTVNCSLIGVEILDGALALGIAKQLLEKSITNRY